MEGLASENKPVLFIVVLTAVATIIIVDAVAPSS